MRDYAALEFGLCAQDTDCAEYPVSYTLTTTAGDVLGETVIRGTNNDDEPDWNLVSSKLSEAGGRAESLEITISFENGVYPSEILLSAPYLTTVLPAGFLYSETYAAHRYDAEVGAILMSRGRARCDERGRLYLTADLFTENPPEVGSTAYFEIRMSGSTGGTLTFSILYEGASADQRRYAKPVSLTAEDGVYIIPVDMLSAIDEYSLQFDGMERNQGFYIYSVRILSGSGTHPEGNDWIGKVSAITREGNTIRFEGTMDRDAVRRFSGGLLRFYALPDWQTDDLSSAVEIGSTKVSTRFESTFDLSAAPVSADTALFFAAVTAGEGDILPLSAPRCADAGEAVESSLSAFGLYGALPVGAFEANGSHVLVDVPLDLLISSAGRNPISLSYAVYGTDEDDARTVFLDSFFLNELDRDIPFYLSAGIAVYLRLTASSPIEGLTYEGGWGITDNFAPDISNPASRSLYAAVVRFLANRYPNIAGIVVGTAANRSHAVGDADFEHPAAYVSSLAELCRITYNAAAIPSLIVCVPLDASGDDGEPWIHDRTLAVMLSKRLGEIGEIPWAPLYTGTTDPGARMNTLGTLLDNLGLARPAVYFALYDPDEAELDAAYMAFAGSETAFTPMEFAVMQYFGFAESASGARAVFYDVEDSPYSSDHEFYDLLKRTAGTGSSVYDWTAEENVSPAGTTVSLWDFSDKHYALDWIPGGGTISCVTEYSPLYSEAKNAYTRVLSSSMQITSSGVAGLILRNLKSSVDLTEVDALTFDFAAESAEHPDGTVSLVFVIGAEDARAEYYANNIPCGTIRQMTCDLTGWEGRDRVDYIGVAVYADYGVSLMLEEVSASSASLTEDELTALFFPTSDTQNEAELDWITLTLVIGFAVIASFVVFVLLSRHEREEKETLSTQRTAHSR